jgi:hypothetical protein
MSRRFDVECTVVVSHTFDDLSAHVEFDTDVAIFPGDQVRVHGPAIAPAYGFVARERRRATIVRSGWLRRWFTVLRGHVDCLSLLEVSFTARSAS